MIFGLARTDWLTIYDLRLKSKTVIVTQLSGNVQLCWYKKPGTGDPLHTQEPVTVASFRTWRGWRECVARDRCLTQSILAFALLRQPNQAISADNLKRVPDILTVGVYCRQIIGVVEQQEGRKCGRYNRNRVRCVP